MYLLLYNTIACDGSCKTCMGSSSDQCLSCSPPFVLCGNKCDDPDTCVCPNGSYLDSEMCKPCTCLCGTPLPSPTCASHCELTDCPPETQEDNSIHQPCSNACIGCYGPTNSDCIKCNTPEGYMRDNSDKCHPRVCTDGTYLNTERTQCNICGSLCKSCDDKESCIECASEVQNSIVNDETICSLCPDGYEYKRGKCEGNS